VASYGYNTALKKKGVGTALRETLNEVEALLVIEDFVVKSTVNEHNGFVALLLNVHTNTTKDDFISESFLLLACN
jgi:hypothetical protein